MARREQRITLDMLRDARNLLAMADAEGNDALFVKFLRDMLGRDAMAEVFDELKGEDGGVPVAALAEWYRDQLSGLGGDAKN